MRVLLIKTSSMGDIIHTLPAITDASLAIPGIQFDWVVEEAFTDIPSWHPSVSKVIPVAFRRLRKNPLTLPLSQEWRRFRKEVREKEYDLILDAQGLVKSAWLTRIARGPRAGLDFHSARETLASLSYQHRYKVNFYQHAINRMRSLFSLALHYPLPSSFPVIGCQPLQQKPLPTFDTPYLVFLHGTTWEAKEWPESYWIELAKLAHCAGFKIKMTGGKAHELARAYRIAANKEWVDVLPTLTISEMAHMLLGASATVAVDTGFGHLSAALNVPTVSLYGPTDPNLTGAIGKKSRHLTISFACSPCLKQSCMYKQFSITRPACYSLIPPSKVWWTVRQLLPNRENCSQ